MSPNGILCAARVGAAALMPAGAAAATLAEARRKTPPRPTAAERAEKRKLDRDLMICIGR